MHVGQVVGDRGDGRLLVVDTLDQHGLGDQGAGKAAGEGLQMTDESLKEEILVNVTPSEVRAALLENGILQEIYIERSARRGVISNIYKGRVSRVLPGMQAAFVDIGLERTAFLYVSDVYNDFLTWKKLCLKTTRPTKIHTSLNQKHNKQAHFMVSLSK